MDALRICIKGNTVLPPVMHITTTPAPCVHTAPDTNCTIASPAPVLITNPATASITPAAPDIGLLPSELLSQKNKMCADPREPNKAVATDCYPLPHVDELFASLQGAKMFSTIDLANAYHQLPLHEDSRDLTAFITHEGLFRFRRVPYGLASTPSAFQKMMADILKELPGVQNLIVYKQTPAEHNVNLEAVLLKLKEAGLVLIDNKCHFREPSLQFLGHTITVDGILPDQKHINAVLKAPPPTDAAALRSFLGPVSWYSKFLPNFATVVAPMRACVSDKNTFLWTDEAQSSFEGIKLLLVNSPALALFNPSFRCILSTDASGYGLGAYLHKCSLMAQKNQWLLLPAH